MSDNKNPQLERIMMENKRCNDCGGLLDGASHNTADFWCECAKSIYTPYTPLEDNRPKSYDQEKTNEAMMLLNQPKITLSDKIRNHIGVVGENPPLWEWFQEALKLESELKSKNHGKITENY